MTVPTVQDGSRLFDPCLTYQVDVKRIRAFGSALRRRERTASIAAVNAIQFASGWFKAFSFRRSNMLKQLQAASRT
jgi:hypothetical protein